MKRLGLFALLGILSAVVYVFFLAPRGEEKLEGMVMPSLEMKILRGNAYQPGRPLLLEFWATWCGPCRDNIPHLNEINKQYGPKGLQVIGMSSEERNVIEQFMTAVTMEYTVAQDVTDEWQEYFRIDAIPHGFLIDAHGKVVWSGHPAALTADSIESVLKAS